MFAAAAASGKAQGGKKGQGLAAGGPGCLGVDDSFNGGVGGRCRMSKREGELGYYIAVCRKNGSLPR